VLPRRVFSPGRTPRGARFLKRPPGGDSPRREKFFEERPPVRKERPHPGVLREASLREREKTFCGGGL